MRTIDRKEIEYHLTSKPFQSKTSCCSFFCKSDDADSDWSNACFSPNGQFLIAPDYWSKCIRIFDVETNECIRRIKTQGIVCRLYSVAINSQNELLALIEILVDNHEKKHQLLNMHTGKCIRLFQLEEGHYLFCMNNDATRFLTISKVIHKINAASYHEIKLWDRETLVLQRHIYGSFFRCNSALTCLYIEQYNHNNNLLIWDLKKDTFKPINFGGAYNIFSITEDGKYVLCCSRSEESRIQLYDCNNNKIIHELSPMYCGDYQLRTKRVFFINDDKSFVVINAITDRFKSDGTCKSARKCYFTSWTINFYLTFSANCWIFLYRQFSRNWVYYRNLYFSHGGIIIFCH